MTELAVRRSGGEIDQNEVRRIAKSKLVPEHIADDPASAEYMMRIGAALGIDPVAAFQHIFIFPDGKGRLKAGMSAHLMHALAIAAGHTLHLEGNALKATAVLVRHCSADDLGRYQMMREEERRQKLGLIEDTDRLYRMQRQQLLDQIEDLRALVDLGGSPAEGELEALLAEVRGLRGKYNFDNLREQVTETKFDLTKLARFESVWTKGRADSIEGLTNKSTWQNYGPEMLKSRAKSGVIRDGAIEVILGMKGLMADLGLQFADDVDDRIAMANVLYTPEERGVEVNEEGAPLIGRVVDVTGPGVSRTQDRTVEAARQLVDQMTPEQLHDWAAKAAQREGLPKEERISRIGAAISAVREAGKADELVPDGDNSSTLHFCLERTLQSIR